MVWKEPGKDKDPWEGDTQSLDLERFLEDLHKRFSSVFRRRRRGRGRSPALYWLIPCAALAWLLTGCYVVDAGARGVDLFLGRLQSVTGPGLHWHAPWPLGDDTLVPGVDQGMDYVHGYGALLTADGNAANLEVTVHYRIVDLPRYLYANASPDGGSAPADVVGRFTDAAVSAAVAHASLVLLMGSGGGGVEDTVETSLSTRLGRYPLGVEVDRVSVAKVTAPAPVASAYAAVRQAETAARQQSDAADAYAADILPKARGEADARVDAARDYATGLVKRAQGDAAAFGDVLAAYRKAPSVTQESLLRTTYEQVLSQVDKVVVLGTDGHVTLSFDKPAETGKAPPVSAPAAVSKGKPVAKAKPSGGGRV
jgi:membrane protease subunit HflK